MNRVLALLCFFAVVQPSSVALGKRYSDAELERMFVMRTPPHYPADLRRRRITGSGVFRLYVDEKGMVIAIGVMESTGNKRLDAEALKALVRLRAKAGEEREIDQPVTFWFGR